MSPLHLSAIKYSGKKTKGKQTQKKTRKKHIAKLRRFPRGVLRLGSLCPARSPELTWLSAGDVNGSAGGACLIVSGTLRKTLEIPSK